MVGKYGEVYVMDWGLARVAGKQDLHDLRMQEPQAGPSSQSVHTERREERDGTPDSPLITLDGTVMGTPAYMSPEQARGELAELGPHSDVYAVGAMLYHLLLVKHIEMPYVPKQARLSQYRVLMLAQEGAPTAIAKLERSAPGPLIAIAEKAMARRIPDRYRNMEELASDLRAYTEGRVVKAYETGSWAETRHWVKRNKALAATIAAGITVLAVGLFTALRLQDETEFARARLAERNEELSSKNSVLRAQAHEQQFRAMIQDLARFRAQCRTQEGLTRKGQPAYQWWLEEANRLLEGAPGDQSDTTEWRPGWKDVQAKLTELRPGALPWSAEDRANDIATHPVQIRIHRLETERDEQCVDVAEELSAPALAVRERLMSQIIYSEFCLGERDGPGEFEVAQANAKQLGSKNVSELNKSAWKFVNPDVNRASPEELVLALLLARRALELAPPDASPAVRDTYAWSLLWLGRTSDALAAADEAIAVAGANRSRYEASKMRMQEQIARWSDSELPARRAELEVWRRDLAAWQLPAEIELQIAQAKASIAEQFESRIAVLRKQAEEQRTWRFADSQTEWWHGQIQQLEADLASLDQMHKAAMASVSTEQAKTRWAHAIESIARSPRYAGQLWPSGRNLTPQIGLLPIGENPSSGLWEFIHLQSGIEPRSGTNGDALRGEAGQLSMAPETGIVFVLLPGGHVPRESSPQGQAEWITGIPLEPFFVSKYETTHEQWDRISLRKEFSRKIKVPLVPANRISWDDAGAMCLRELGWCELPTEVQWEYACRGGTTTRWWCGDDESNLETAASIAWTPSNGTPNTRALRPVGELAPNPFGLHDVHGNVLEWCADSSPVLSDPRPGDGRRDNGSDNSVAREFRGGSWKLGPESSASSYRNSEPPGARFDDIGVRLIRRVTP
jgi:formylglycine-generating enzyme required for sulfatase activity